MKTIVFDFDGVVHSYTSGWLGANIIPDPPVKGIKEAIKEIRKRGYSVIIMSTRAATENGRAAIIDYLNRNEITVDGITNEKPPAICYIDDRGVCFDGNASKLPDLVSTFVPWNKRS